MTKDQIQSLIRSILISVGAFAAGKGWITSAQASWLSTDAALPLIGMLAAAGGAVWSAISRKQSNMVATVAAMPEVNKVETTATPAGQALATSANSASAGTVVAAKY